MHFKTKQGFRKSPEARQTSTGTRALYDVKGYTYQHQLGEVFTCSCCLPTDVPRSPERGNRGGHIGSPALGSSCSSGHVHTAPGRPGQGGTGRCARRSRGPTALRCWRWTWRWAGCWRGSEARRAQWPRREGEAGCCARRCPSGRVLKPIVQNPHAARISRWHFRPLGVNLNDREGFWPNSQATISSRSESSRSTWGRKGQRSGFCLLLGTKVKEEGSGKIHCSLSYPFNCQHQLTTGVQ